MVFWNSILIKRCTETYRIKAQIAESRMATLQDLPLELICHISSFNQLPTLAEWEEDEARRCWPDYGLRDLPLLQTCRLCHDALQPRFTRYYESTIKEKRSLQYPGYTFWRSPTHSANYRAN